MNTEGFVYFKKDEGKIQYRTNHDATCVEFKIGEKWFVSNTESSWNAARFAVAKKLAGIEPSE